MGKHNRTAASQAAGIVGESTMKKDKKNNRPDKINEAYELMGDVFSERRDGLDKYEYRNMEQAMGQIMFGNQYGPNW
jgi:hypothetical protein